MRPEFSSDPADGAQGPGQTQISHLLPALDLLISGDLSRACHTEASSLLSETVQLSVLNPANVSMGIAFLYACLTFVLKICIVTGKPYKAGKLYYQLIKMVPKEILEYLTHF